MKVRVKDLQCSPSRGDLIEVTLRQSLSERAMITVRTCVQGPASPLWAWPPNERDGEAEGDRSGRR